MPPISEKKKEVIKEQILHYLFDISPDSSFTSKIAETIARDEEFIKTILIELKKKQLIIEVNKNPNGKQYLKRQRWRLSQQAYEAYKQHQ